MTLPDEQLLRDALVHSTGREPADLGMRPLPINTGVSGVDVRRLEVALADGPTLRLVTKPCGLAERRTLAALDGLSAVPRAFVPDTTGDEVREVVMADAGETLLAFDLDAKRRAAEALSEVHARFLGRERELAWMPRLERRYLDDFIVAKCWRGAWDEALKDERFMTTFGGWVRSKHLFTPSRMTSWRSRRGRT